MCRLAAFVLFLLTPTLGYSQFGSTGNSPKPAGGRPDSTRVGFFELMRSGGEVLVEAISPADAQNPDVVEWEEISGPRSTILTFYSAMQAVAEGRGDAWERAEMTVPDNVENVRDKARNLRDVLDRLPKLSPGSIPSGDEMEERRATRFEFFPRGISRDWAYIATGGEIDGSITLEATGDGQWKFTKDTLDSAGDLLKSMKSIPPRPRFTKRGAMFREIVYPTFQNTSVRGWLTVAGLTLAFLIVSWLLYRGLSWLATKCENEVIAPLVNAIRIPLVVVIFAACLFFATQAVHLTPTLDNFFWKVVETLLVLAGACALVLLIELIVLTARNVATDKQHDHYTGMMTTVFRQAMRVAVAIALLIFISQNVFNWDITAILGGVGIIALAMSLAAKDAAANLFGAATIFISRPFLVGDWIIFDGRVGVVETVNLQNTNVRLLTGEQWSVPNMSFVDTPVENLSGRRYLRRVLKLGIRYDTPAEKVDEAIDILRDVLTSDAVAGEGKGDLDNHPPEVNFVEFADANLTLRADYWYMMDHDGKLPQRDTDRGYMSWLSHCTTVNTIVLERFNDAGIDFAFPTQTIHLESGNDEIVKRLSEQSGPQDSTNA